MTTAPSQTATPDRSAGVVPMVALVGNPNTGKTTLFNALTGLRQHTGNYPGVTVEKKVGRLKLGGRNPRTVDIIDLPGAYSLAARSPDELVVADVLLGQQKGTRLPEAVLIVADASNLERNLFLVTQVIECGRPVVLALNMMDLARSRGIAVDPQKLGEELGCRVVPVTATKREGLDDLRQALDAAVDATPQLEAPVTAPMPDAVEAAVLSLQKFFEQRSDQLARPVHRVEAMRVLIDRGGAAERRMLDIFGQELAETLDTLRAALADADVQLVVVEPETRYGRIEQMIHACLRRTDADTGKLSASDRMDAVLTHPLSGTLIFAVLMAVVFQAIYSWAGPLMDLIEAGQGLLAAWVGGWIPAGTLNSLVVDGVIGGVGAVVIFLPQICILFAFIAILEDCGYMARAAFLMDRLLSRVGLSGRSFVPMLSSFACAIPGVMAARVIENRRDRFTTMMVAPLMSCSARLPVYIIFIGAFIPDRQVLGVLNLQGLTLLAMYLVGVTVAIPVAWVLKKTLLRGPTPPFVMEMPSFKWPGVKLVLMRVLDRGKAFLVRAGTIIFAVTIIVWALLYFPRSGEIAAEHDRLREQASADLAGEALDERLAAIGNLEEGAYLRDSYLGRAGHFIEPAVRPLGWDWKVGVATLASFPAREVIVATMGTIYNLGPDEDEQSDLLRAEMRAATYDSGPRAGEKVFTPLVAVSVMVFFALCCQCGATLAVIKRETASWRWPIFSFAYMTALAYIASLLVYQVGSALGWA